MPRNFFIDDDLNRDWIKAIAKIRLAMGLKAGRFVTIEGKPVFVGGPSQGAGRAGSGGAGQFSMFTEEQFAELEAGDVVAQRELDARLGNAVRFENGEAEEFGNTEWEEWRNGVGYDEQEAIELYSGDGYEEMNGTLRKGDPPGSVMEDKAFDYFAGSGQITEDEWDEWSGEYTDQFSDMVIKNLDNAIQDSGAPQDMIVYRGAKSKYFSGLQPGDEWGDNGFISTSLSRGATQEFGDYQLEILVRKGSPAAFLNGLSDFPQELEVLLPSGSKFNILSMNDTGAVLELQ